MKHIVSKSVKDTARVWNTTYPQWKGTQSLNNGAPDTMDNEEYSI